MFEEHFCLKDHGHGAIDQKWYRNSELEGQPTKSIRRCFFDSVALEGEVKLLVEYHKVSELFSTDEFLILQLTRLVIACKNSIGVSPGEPLERDLPFFFLLASLKATVIMDRSWINAKRTSEEYENGVEEFLEFASSHVAANNGNDKFYCPCVKCLNDKIFTANEIREHVICDGFNKKYTRWIWHGEFEMSGLSRNEEARNEEGDEAMNDEEMTDNLEEMINDIGAEAFEQANVNKSYNNLSVDADKSLYPGCKNFSRLAATLKLISLKAAHGWSDKSFTELLGVLKSMLPENNELPDSNYTAKKILCPLGLGYKKIHACPNDCVLYRKGFKDMHECPICGISRYKKSDDDGASYDASTKKPPAKVLWYLPIIPRFKRLFASPTEAKNLRWHADQRIDDGQLRHPADSPQWKKMDQLYPSFGDEPRNLRLGLCTDGMNPYGNLSSQHSAWPYIMLSMMISGVDVFDAYKKEIFTMRAMVFCTINDFPAYGNLSGYSNKGHKACPKCGDRTCYHQLQHGRKTVYLGYRKWLKPTHPYRKFMKAFNGKQENDKAPNALTPEQHCIDVMHVEKNVSESLIGTLLNIQGKTKDNLNSRKDMEAMGIRRELAPVEHVQPYLDAHMALLKEQNPKKTERWLVNAHNKSFSSWFKDHVRNDDSTPELIGWLASGPNFDVLFWQGYDINGYSFYTKDRDDKSTVQNSGVIIESESMHFSSSKDKNPLRATSSHYGIIEEIWEVDYLKFKIPVFKCKWVDGNNGVKVDELGVTLVDFSKVGSKNEPFVMASQVKQVFYITDPSNKNVSVVLHGKRIISGDDNDESSLDVSEISAFSSGLPNINSEVISDDVQAVRVDHTEGIWENIPTF
ncbi:hypothetical protein CASFOL_006457 [Castilleja foliolosa]|uniref:Transposase n=1 Tax=Castilleja foliolosa TaxID=1961234 RepID=A0ABD3E7D0_9LAMI